MEVITEIQDANALDATNAHHERLLCEHFHFLR